MATQQEWAEYEFKKERYHEQLAQYNEQLALWESLSPTEQQRLHLHAEKAALRGWTLSGVCLIGIAAYVYLSTNNYVGNTLWLYTGAAVVGSSVILFPLSKIFGRLFRGCILTAVCSGIVYLIIWFIQAMTNGVPNNAIKFAITGAIAFLILLVECTGGYHASAAPERPERPIPPA
jgi:predicted small integral membrane protein